MCLISFEKVKRKTANIRSRASSWSLMLFTVFNQRCSMEKLAHIRDK
jgi:hypothetical protein